MRSRNASRYGAVRRPALTLVELLIVVAILVALLGLALPMMQPVFEGREIREAARLVSGLFEQAQAEAIATGRPVGVLFERQIQNNVPSSVVFQMSVAKVPPPYTGAVQWARARIVVPPGQMVPTGPNIDVSFEPADAALPTLVQANDLIRFNYRGHYYRILNVAPGGVTIALDDKRPPQPSIDVTGVPYQILRQPRKTPTQPVQLPTPAAVDMELSGEGLTGFLLESGLGQNGLRSFVPPGSRDFVIAFSPTGGIDHIYPIPRPGDVYSIGIPRKPIHDIHLLIGRSDQVGRSVNPQGGATATKLRDPIDPTNTTTPLNLVDGKNLWVTISRRSGKVLTSPNNIAWLADTTTPFAKVAAAREFTRTGKGTGGS